MDEEKFSRLEERYYNVRTGLFFFTLFSILHIVLLMMGKDVFTFSSTLAHRLMLLWIKDGSIPAGACSVAVTGLWIFVWMMSREGFEWLIEAFLMVGADMYLLFENVMQSNFIDILIHAVLLGWILYGIITGIRLALDGYFAVEAKRRKKNFYRKWYKK